MMSAAVISSSVSIKYSIPALLYMCDWISKTVLKIAYNFGIIKKHIANTFLYQACDAVCRLGFSFTVIIWLKQISTTVKILLLNYMYSAILEY